MPRPVPASAAEGQAEMLALSRKFETFADLKNGNAAQFTCLMTAFARGYDSKRPDAIINDPYAEMLAGPEGEAFAAFWAKGLGVEVENPALTENHAMRARFIDEALLHRPDVITQVVVLGAGMDSRAFRLETLRNSKVFEIDGGVAMQERKKRILAEHGVKSITKEYHTILADLGDDGWGKLLTAKGFDPKVPTFWIMEGVISYMTYDSVAQLLKVVDAMSAPESQLWADVCTEGCIMDNWLEHIIKFEYGEDDPLHGSLATLKWDLALQADFAIPNNFFGRKWTPICKGLKANGSPNIFVPSNYLLATKPKASTKPKEEAEVVLTPVP